MKNTPNVLGDDSLGFWRGGVISHHRDVWMLQVASNYSKSPNVTMYSPTTYS